MDAENWTYTQQWHAHSGELAIHISNYGTGGAYCWDLRRNNKVIDFGDTGTIEGAKAEALESAVYFGWRRGKVSL